MPRVYHTKGPERLSAVISVPVTAALARELRERSRSSGVAVTEIVRRLVRQGLEQGRAA